MARLKKQIIGKLSGKFGDIVFRNTRRTNYIAARPSSFNLPMDEGSITRRSKFAISGKYSSLILSIPELKYFWSNETPDKVNIFNYLVKTFYPFVDSKGLTENVSLTPAMGFIVQPITIEINNEVINVTIKAIGNRSGIDIENEKSIKLFSVISLNSPTESNLKSYTLIALNSENVALTLVNDLQFTIPLTNQITDLMNKYSNRLMLFCLITFDIDSRPVNYSATFYNR